MTDDAMDKPVEELLPRYVEGKTTVEETAAVDRWLEASAENRKILEDMQMLELAMAENRSASDAGKAWRRVSRKIGGRSRVLLWATRAAAILSIPLLAGVIFLARKVNSYGDDVRMVEVRTNPGMNTTVTLPDNSVVTLNSESTLTYPQRFTGKTREVSLTGEAFFKVEKDARCQFVVNSLDDTKIRVYGTTFDVDAYPEFGAVDVTLIEGSVGFENKNAAGSPRQYRLAPGQKATYRLKDGETTISQTEGESETAWTEGKIVLRDTPLADALKMLSKRFGVAFDVRNPDVSGYSFTGTFDTHSLDQILDYFEMSTDFNWRYEDSTGVNHHRKIVVY